MPDDPVDADTLADVLAAMAGHFTGSALAAEIVATAVVAAIVGGRVRNISFDDGSSAAEPARDRAPDPLMTADNEQEQF